VSLAVPLKVNASVNAPLPVVNGEPLMFSASVNVLPLSAVSVNVNADAVPANFVGVAVHTVL